MGISMKNNKSYIPGLVLVAFVWLALSAWCFIKPADEMSLSERRRLAAFPEISLDKIQNGSFMSEFEEYTLDQFPMRDEFRTLKAVSSMYIFGKKDNNGIYVADGYASKLDYPLNEKSVTDAADKLTAIYDRYIKGTGSKVYLSIVPDKNYFLAAKNGYPAMDYNRMFSLMKENMPYAEYIDITGTLELADYYRTDTHWKQENIAGSADKIAKAMGNSELDGYETVQTDISFRGVYCGQSALPLQSEKIKYITNDTLQNCRVLPDDATGFSGYAGMYDFDRLYGNDPYDIYLSGARPVVRIENPGAKSGKELIVFRDSFGSSLVPLLAQEYSKITVFDTRYMVPDLIGGFAEFDNADVLFVYSTLLLNKSQAMKDFIY